MFHPEWLLVSSIMAMHWEEARNDTRHLRLVRASDLRRSRRWSRRSQRLRDWLGCRLVALGNKLLQRPVLQISEA